MRRVLIIQGSLKQYRVPLFEKLRDLLATESITLEVGYAQPPAKERSLGDNATLPPPLGVEVNAWRALGGKLLYMPLLRRALAADLVIVEQANKHAINHLLLPLSALRLRSIALWGLAENKQADRNSLSEWWKRHTLAWPRWWFAYTEGTARYLVTHGVPPERVTAVNNAVDTKDLSRAAASISPDELASLRGQLGISDGDPVGVYCGMLDPVKALPFLIEASRRIRAAIPRFHLVLIGGGPLREQVERDTADAPWIHHAGPRFRRDKALWMRLGNALLVPGRVGLVVLDGFATGLPVLTTELPNHGPEIEYLERGYNGLATAHDVASYADAVIALFSDRERLARMQAAARASGEVYTIDGMAERFADGIRRCLASR